MNCFAYIISTAVSVRNVMLCNEAKTQFTFTVTSFPIKVELCRNYRCVSGDKSKVQKLVQMAWTFVNDR